MRFFKLTTIIYILFVSLSIHAQTISGVINSYARVVNINGNDFTIDNVSGNQTAFATGKLVLIIQMKGATVNTSNSYAYGSITNLNEAGNYEFARVNAMTGSTVTFSGVLNQYNVNGYVQLVSVPEYNDVTVNGNINGIPWNKNTGRGGIIAMEIAGTLTMSGNINADGIGFKGAAVNTSASGAANDSSSFVTNQGSGFGMKGEGISEPVAGFEYGRGGIANGGGGGNTHNAGGGGGSNNSSGGVGGHGWPGAGGAPANAGGRSGHVFTYAAPGAKIFMGGGGGSGQQNNNRASAGANGGGIVIVRANTITSDCASTYSITADGNDANNSSGNDGAGGAGAGGVVLLDVINYNLTCQLDAHANGGNGGDVATGAAHGGGAGGGAGIIMLGAPTGSVFTNFDATTGLNGRDCNTCGSSGTPPNPPTNPIITGVVIPGGDPLPVTLSYFSGKSEGDQVVLNWVTTSEKNNDYFEVQRSGDGKNFVSIGHVNGAGNSNTTLEYVFTDNHPLNGNAYYRLKQVDVNGTASYSDVVAVSFSFVSEATLDVFPNPYNGNGRLNLKLNGHTGNKEVLVILLDPLGQQVVSKVFVTDQNGSFIVGLDPTDQLASGIYTITGASDNQVFQQKLVIQ